jgi:hypothetical protein
MGEIVVGSKKDIPQRLKPKNKASATYFHNSEAVSTINHPIVNLRFERPF